VTFSATREQLGDNSYVISFDGKLDLTSASRLKKLLFDLVAAGARSIAAGVLIIADNALRRNGGRLHVRGAENHNEALAHLVQRRDGLRGADGSGNGSG
jgi:anti-anti-sigma regulatory factor